MVSKPLSQLKTDSPLNFARFEFKYILSAVKRKRLERDLLYFLEYDPFVAHLENHRYFVRSLYYDDPKYTAFHDKIDGLHSRSKFRVRTYSQNFDDAATIFLEIKGRHNNLVFKNRTPVLTPGVNWIEIEGPDFSDAILNRTEQCAVRDQFQYNLYRKRLVPVALVDYERRPYLSRYDPSFRITFDERLSTTQSTGLFPSINQTFKKVIAGYTIMEVKLQSHLPSWFHRVIQTHELRRVSVSKIVTSMETLGLAHDEQ